MVAAVEKMTVRKGSGKTWHGEENNTDVQAKDFTLAKWAEDAGMNWSAQTTPLYHKVIMKNEETGEDFDSYVPCEDQIAVRRETDNRILGYHSPGYEIVQPGDMLAFLDGYIQADPRFQWETAGSLAGGRKVFATAHFAEDFKVLGEAHKPYLFASTSFDGSLATTLGSTMTRIVCQNTLRMALSAKETAQLKFKHRTEWNETTVAGAKRQLEQVMQGFGHYSKLAEALATHRISVDAAEKMLSSLLFTSKLEELQDEAGATVKVWSKPSTRTSNNIEKLIQSYKDTVAEGTEAGTGWTLFNAITRYADHGMGVRMTEGREKAGDTMDGIKLESALFGAGDKFKQTGLQSLLAMANVNVKELVEA